MLIICFQFFFLDAEDLHTFPKLDSQKSEHGKFKVRSGGTLYGSLLEEFSSLPNSPKMTDYAVVNVAPSVVPNPYLPAFRVFSYNITGASGDTHMVNQKRKHGEHRNDRNSTASCENPDYQKTWRCHLDQPWNSDENSPSRSNQRWSPLGYAQVSA
jgi:endopolyphosphatase